MQENIHPKYYPLQLIMNDGTKFTTYSASDMGSIILDSDITTHPAWTGGLATQANLKAGKVAKFNNKFGDFLSTKSDKNEEA